MQAARREFEALLDTAQLQKGDVIFVLQGDGLSRAPYAAELYKKGFAPLVAIVGNASDRSYGSYPSEEVRDEMIRLGIRQDKIIFEKKGANTRAEAERAMVLAKHREWKSILILTSPHHEYRAFLTFLKAMRDAKLDLTLVRATAPLSWTEATPWGKRVDLLHEEFDKIAEYQKKGDVALYRDGVDYFLKKHA